jgi:glycosyltransferase involved in cell wall biosynthesis
MRGIVREAPIWPAFFRPANGRPRVAFLPARGREMSSLLRIYRIAERLPGLGWSVIVLPPTLSLAQRHRLLRRFGPDVIVMQGARHALNRPALYPGYHIVYDMDDADFHLPHLAGLVAEAMTGVALVLAGSRYVADWCRARGAPARVVWTGTPRSPSDPRPQHGRPLVVAWAQSAPVDYVEERAFVLDVMRRVAARRPGVRLRLFGRRPEDDAALFSPFAAAGVAVEWLPMMPYDRFLGALDDVAVGLSPICPRNPFSRGKSFGKVLAYLDRGVPVVASDEADHGLFFTPDTGVLSSDPGVWAAEVDRLLDDAEARQAMADAALAAFRDRLTTDAAAREVDAALRNLLAERVAARPDLAA